MQRVVAHEYKEVEVDKMHHWVFYRFNTLANVNDGFSAVRRDVVVL